MHESSRVVITTSLLVGEATKPLDIENTLCITSRREEEMRNTSWRIVSSHHLAKEHPGILWCVFVTGPILSLLFFLFCSFLSLSLSLAFLFLFLSTLALSSFFLAVRSSTWMSSDVSKTRYILLTLTICRPMYNANNCSLVLFTSNFKSSLLFNNSEIKRIWQLSNRVTCNIFASLGV